MNEWKKAVEALSPADWEDLITLNTKIQSHTEPWGEIIEAKKIAEQQYESGYIALAPLVSEFIILWHEKGLVIPFDWPEWQEGRDWFAIEGDAKYDTLDDETALKLITAIIRNNRFNEDALYRAFNEGYMQKIINSFVMRQS